MLQDSLFRKKKKTEKKKQYGTDSRAGVRFRFNVCVHVDEGLWERLAGEELGFVWKGVGLAGVPRGSRPFCTYKRADVTHCYLQGRLMRSSLFTAAEVALLAADGEF